MARNENAKTRRFALNLLKAGVAITGAALLFACGDDSSSGTDNSQIATGVDSTVESVDDLINCTPKHEGETAYIKEEKATYVCVDGDWITGSISESVDDLINCTSKHEGETVFVKEDKEIYVCTDGDWVVAGETLDEGDDDGDDADKKSSSSKAKSSSSVESSSSVIPGSDPESSSSLESSSSVIPGSDPESSSSLESSSSVIPGSDPESSSSEGGGGASSSSVIASSSSEEQAGSSSSDELSSSSRSLFEMSKDEFLNPKISYSEMTDPRDKKTYKTVKIDDQVWMAENLNYADSTKTPSLKGKSWCYYDKAENCEVTGRLYTWAAAIDSVALANDADNPQTCGYGKTYTLPTVVQGVCPEGWHLPSYDEWQTLFTAVGGSSKAGTALKSQTGWYSQTGDAADRDAYGFSALPAGYRGRNGNIGSAGDYAFFWSASEGSSYYAYKVYLYYDFENARLDFDYKDLGHSVRCLQN